MARPDRRLPHNAPGDWYVDATCIDCDTCRWMAPETFAERGSTSIVHAQPRDPAARARAEMAAVACPTASIGTVGEHAPWDDVTARFPERIATGPGGSEVLHCGFHARASYGATSYLLRREGGNVLVDSPRFNEGLAARIEALGGARWMFLTHADDVADHARWRERLRCERVLHERDADDVTRGVERLLKGDADVVLAPGLVAIPTPGHTAGSACLLADDTFLFTGDHLAFDSDGALIAFDDACWFDWSVQTESVRKLLGYRFSWVLPGHGRRGAADPDEMRALVAACAARM